jgi:uncharacterized Fe-S center protein
MSQVYLYNFEGRNSFIAEEAMERLYENLNLQIDEEEIVGIKVHAGEYGNRTFLRPQNVKPIVDIVKNRGGTPLYLIQQHYTIKGGIMPSITMMLHWSMDIRTKPLVLTS